MLINLARGRGGARRRRQTKHQKAADGRSAFKEAGLPPPDMPLPLSFSGQEMRFAWRSHFVAASVAPLTKDDARGSRS